MSRASLYDPDVHAQITERINRLSNESRPEWGKMDAGQMCAHCADALEVMNGERELGPTPLVARIFKGAIRKAVVGDKPFRKNSPTHPDYLEREPRDLDEHRRRLIEVVGRFVEEDEETAAAREHPAFGQMTREERGWSMYKHLDHHLSQFGV